MPSENTIGQPPEAKLDNTALSALRAQYVQAQVDHGAEIAAALLREYDLSQLEFDRYFDPSCPGPISPEENLPGFACVLANAVLMGSVLPQPTGATIAT